jgi:hypothetical protein
MKPSDFEIDYIMLPFGRMLGFLVSFMIVLLSIVNESKAQYSFQLDFATDKFELLYGGQVDSVGNAILVGARGIGTPDTSEAWVVKVKPDGRWISRFYKKQDTASYIATVTILNNGNYFMTGAWKTVNAQYFDHFWIVITDTALNVLTEKSFDVANGYEQFDEQKTVLTNSGDVVVACNMGKWNGFRIKYDYFLMKFNSEGDTLLSRLYPTGMDIFDSSPFCWRRMPNSNSLMLIGRCFNKSNQNELEFFDQDLNFIKYSRLPWSGSGYFCSDVWLSDTEFLMTEDRVEDLGLINLYYVGVCRLDTAGHYYQELRIDHPDTVDNMAVVKSMSYFNDSVIYIGSFEPNFFSLLSPTAVYLSIIDKDMNLLGQKNFGGDYNYNLYLTLSTPDKGCILVCTKYDTPGVLEADVMIKKVLYNEITLFTQIEDMPSEKFQFRVWPNPVQDDLYIGLAGFKVNETIHFRIFDISGRKYLDQKLMVSGNTIHTNVRNLKTGIYIYEVVNLSGERNTGKFIKN